MTREPTTGQRTNSPAGRGVVVRGTRYGPAAAHRRAKMAGPASVSGASQRSREGAILRRASRISHHGLCLWPLSLSVLCELLWSMASVPGG